MQSNVQYPNVNALRLALAIAVTWSHSYELAGHAEPFSQLTGFESAGNFAVKAFFFISGFLVCASFVKGNGNLGEFVTKRFLRVWPALVAALMLSIAIAWMVTTASAPEFWKAAAAFAGRNVLLVRGLDYTLPGVFENLPQKAVNGSLWTLQWEVLLYALTAILGCLGILYRPQRFNTALICLLAVMAAAPFVKPLTDVIKNNSVPLPFAFAFLMGMAVCVNARPALHDLYGLVFAVAGSAIWIVGFPDLGSALLACGFALTVGFSRRLPVLSLNNDLSYGVYVYSFPIQQLLVWRGITDTWKIFAAAIVIVIPIAYISWRFLEKPCLSFKNRISGLRRAELGLQGSGSIT